MCEGCCSFDWLMIVYTFGLNLTTSNNNVINLVSSKQTKSGTSPFHVNVLQSCMSALSCHLSLTSCACSGRPVKDLEQYASSYSGFMRIERLQFIAEHCPQLRVEALKMALSFVQRTFNVDSYEEVHRKLAEATRSVWISSLPKYPKP